MRTKNTELFSAIGEFISGYIDEYGISPSVREIAEGTGMSRSNAQRYVAEMRENGLLSAGDAHRSLVTGRDSVSSRQTVRIPILGEVACGLPKLAEENIEEYVRLPVSVFGRGDFYLLRAKGDSMTGAGICDGDLVLIRQQSTASPGQIVVALAGDEATLKRYYPEPERRRIRLHPENPAMDDIYVDDCAVQGVAVKVIRDLI